MNENALSSSNMPYSEWFSTETGFHFAQSKQINTIFPTVEMALVVRVRRVGGIMPIFADILPGASGALVK